MTIKCERLSRLEASTVDLVTAPELAALLKVARAAEDCAKVHPDTHLMVALGELKRAMEKRTLEQKLAMAEALSYDLEGF